MTCDVDFATPAIQEAINRGVLAVSPCIGTDQMGPQRFGEAGKLAFTFGNVAQDEGAAMAEFALDQGWTDGRSSSRTTSSSTSRTSSTPLRSASTEHGGEVVQTEEYLNSIAGAETGGTVQNVISAIADTDVDVIAISTAYDDLPALVDGIRSLGERDADHLLLGLRRHVLEPRGALELLPRVVCVAGPATTRIRTSTR